MKITAERLRELERAEMKLNALEAGGVDNWEFYGEALDEYNKSIEKEEAAEKAFDEMCEILSTGVDQPAGIGCGYGFMGDSLDKAFEVFKRFID